jgi:hypothetical protein
LTLLTRYVILLPTEANMETKDLDSFTKAYISAMFFIAPEDGGAMDGSIDDLSPETLAEVVEECQKFLTENKVSLLNYPHSLEYAGHDFALTRNRHGAGFWDRDYTGPQEIQAGKDLTKASHDAGEKNFYRGDDGKIYQE